ncbi:bifunctional tRNA (adenosine(37)-N6)-threonylcarbamoyltransferase complex dimerization subunit type 1 TsaB/ribosomal protein alanine acetyltransferase RimI [Brackiella oedipodis]|uniref:bifunctional tRNA (adenosine(37)-N6)-threonylcarbamoyltransferase complex dimerization subunit type 1 TsaB/ribosomal protein alanine acetyltransferase RimI n=1 Tax=Brackiella oedipodis TaxID=124225 RepID=UPI000688A4EC|nr:bifunctional tRNA (adenosine(37)-N6)-threonylcarbamoyltransferase complex dimerization subunit type 1 TsaB/ribosomal protein alanine acetyltransferase RimI [Brackiella oedipodis]
MLVNLLSVESAANQSSVALLQFPDHLPYQERLQTLSCPSLLAPTQAAAAQDATDSAVRLWQQYSQAGRQHSEQIPQMLDRLLAQAGIGKQDLHAVAFGQGPGAFTGLRIACGMAQGLSLALDIPVVAIDSLRAAAQLSMQALQPGQPLVVLLDARMQECYMAVYQLTPDTALVEGQIYEDPLTCVQMPSLIQVSDVALYLQSQWPEQSVLLAGNALQEYPQLLAQLQQQHIPYQLGSTDWFDASVIAQLALPKVLAQQTLDPALAAPIYIRNKVAFTEAERAQGAGGNPRAHFALPSQPSTITDASASACTAIRPMREQDIEAVLAIEQAVQTEPWSRGNFADSLKSGYQAFVYVQPEPNSGIEQVCGYALQMLAPDVAHLLLIGVAPHQQGQGIGQALLKRLEASALQAGLSSQMLEVRQSNQQAKRFYEQANYLPIGIRKGYYKGVNGASEDAIMLQKELTP